MLFLGSFIPLANAQSLNKNELKLADNLSRAGNFESALAIYQKFYRSGNASPNIISGISRSLERLNQIQEWIVFLKEVIVKNPAIFNYQIDLGRAYYIDKQTEVAFTTWEKVYSFEPAELMRFRLVAQALTNLRLFDEAIDVYKKGMAKLKNQEAMHLDIGTLYKAQLNYEEATKNYLIYFQKFKKQSSYVRSLLIGMAKDDEASDRIINTIEQNNINNDADVNELLANLYMSRKKYPEALKIILAIESADKDRNYAYLNRFAREAEKDRAYLYVINAFEYIIDQSEKTSPQVKYRLARAHFNYGIEFSKQNENNKAEENINKALNILEQLILANIPEKYVAAELTADIYKRYFNDLDRSLEYYHMVNLNRIGINNADRVRLKIADTYIQKNDINTALGIYKEVKSKKYLIFAQYNTAEIYYYNASFNKAKKQFESLIGAVGMKDTLANNALERIFEIQQFASDSLSFAKYTAAQLLKRQNKYSEAAGEFRDVFNLKKEISNTAGLKAALLYSMLNKMSDAKSILEQFIQESSEDESLDYAIFLLANLYKTQNDYPQALTMYQDLLLRFPTSFYSEQARTFARELNNILQEKTNP